MDNLGQPNEGADSLVQRGLQDETVTSCSQYTMSYVRRKIKHHVSSNISAELVHCCHTGSLDGHHCVNSVHGDTEVSEELLRLYSLVHRSTTHTLVTPETPGGGSRVKWRAAETLPLGEN
ncbi:hypothetical protein E2C01_032538 [Portunus trituberculatus]|uniref:Uncharacterized protein n=1 Tax=Portunus trituberculatus TaxID=210409 RepID=A0A5B7F1A6_PORTR|nr:hypothetical protein [Portunus trituberculatus]